MRRRKTLHVLLCLPKGLSNDDVGVARGTVVQEAHGGRMLVYKTGGDFVQKEKFGGAAVERLPYPVG